MVFHPLQDAVKTSVDVLSVTSLALVIGELLTPVVLLLTLVWTVIRIHTALIENRIKRKELKNETQSSKIRNRK